MPRWGIVATVDEPACLVAAMVLHHFAQGATEAHLFLDRPDPELQELLRNHPNCLMTVCDPAFWSTTVTGRRPDTVQAMQELNAQLAYDKAGVDWLLHLDADEFVDDGVILGRELAALPAQVDCLMLRNVERAFWRGQPQQSLFSGVFRKSRNRFKWLGPWIYGPGHKQLNKGIYGHARGKTLTRVGRGHSILIHSAAPGKNGPRPALTKVVSSATWLLHFHGLTPLHWKIKLLRKSLQDDTAVVKTKPGNQKRTIDTVRRHATNQTRLDALVSELLSVSRLQALALRILGMTLTARNDPGAALLHQYPQAMVTPSAFDAILIRREAEVFARTGFHPAA